MQIYWNKRKCLHKKRVQLPQDWFGTPTWPLFHCFGKPIWPPWRHVKTLYRAFSVTWLAAMQIYWKVLHKRNAQLLHDMVWNTNIAAVLLFWYTNGADVMSFVNALYILYVTRPCYLKQLNTYLLVQERSAWSYRRTQKNKPFGTNKMIIVVRVTY